MVNHLRGQEATHRREDHSGEAQDPGRQDRIGA